MSLRILLLDDNPDDRLLTMRELHREFPDVTVTQVANRGDYEHAVDRAGYDLVITDYQMRWITGLDVTRALRARWPDTPIVMFTATGTQEVAVEAMKAGLDDYVIKSPRHYVRLALSVRAALQRREARRRALRSEARLQLLLDHTRVGVFAMRPDGVLLDANRAFRALIGLDPRDPLAEARHPLLETLRPRLSSVARGSPPLELALTIDTLQGPGRILSVKLVHAGGEDVIDGLVDDTTATGPPVPAGR